MTTTIKIDVPYNGWRPRPHQIKLWEYLQRGGKRAMAVWHRRAGKDEVCLHHTMRARRSSVSEITGTACRNIHRRRKAIWTAVNAHTGKRRIDEAFPHELRANTNDNEMFIRFNNGSTWQCHWQRSIRRDSRRRSSLAGIVFTE